MRLRRGLHRQREMKRGTFLRDAFHPHLAAHQFDQAFADGQAKAGAAVLPCGRSIRLAERFEQPRQTVDRNSNAGVAH